jgi:Flp pilus assembly pilin Flp
MVEYIVLAALIALTAVVALQASGRSLKELFCNLAHRGADSAAFQECMGREVQDPDTECTGSPSECGLEKETSTPSIEPSATSTLEPSPTPTIDTCPQIIMRQCPSSPAEQRCVRYRESDGQCVESCEPCPVDNI